MDRRTSISLLAVALIGTACLAQKTLKVPSQYKTIQAAINAATKGDTVLVATGTYKESIDFKGKRIAVIAERGPTLTVIDGNGADQTITLQSSEPSEAALCGFTVTGGRKGIVCRTNSAPLLSGNIVTGNRESGILSDSKARIIGNTIFINERGISTYGAETIERNIIEDNYVATPSHSGGAGIWSRGTPTIRGNTIRNNKVRGCISGGGLFLGGDSALVEDNLIQGNEMEWVSPTPLCLGAGMLCLSGPQTVIRNNHIVGNRFTGVGGTLYSYGGGACIGAFLFINNTVYGNTCTFGAGICVHSIVGATTTIVNSVMRNNGSTEIFRYWNGNPVISYCNVRGGWTGTGNIDKDPKFVDASNGDFHLSYNSPCRDAGDASAKGIPSTDYEGDPRVSGTAPDIGADEFHPHLYYSSHASPGSYLSVNIIGPPSRTVYWAWSSSPNPLDPPIVIPGLTGQFALPFPFALIRLPNVGATGSFKFPVAIPKELVPPRDFATQALIGQHLSNAEVARVR